MAENPHNKLKEKKQSCLFNANLTLKSILINEYFK